MATARKPKHVPALPEPFAWTAPMVVVLGEVDSAANKARHALTTEDARAALTVLVRRANELLEYV